MPKILPFKAIRPARDKASLVTSRSYEEYNAAELASQLDFNPFSFLHVVHPGYVNLQKDDAGKRFGKVREKYLDFKRSEILVEEEDEYLYLYELKSKDQIFTGIIGEISLADYRSGKIKKHEDTLKYRVEQFREYLEIAGFNTEPVLVAHQPDAFLSEYIREKKTKRPLYHFSTLNRDLHTIWRIKDKETISQITAVFGQMDSLYIADGHHRCASADRLFEEHPENEKASAFMGFLIDENEVKIHAYNRLVQHLNGLSAGEFLEKASEDFQITNRGHELWQPEKKGEFGMYLDGDFYQMTPKEPSEQIDPTILNEKIIAKILGITDLRSDGRIEYLPGNQPLTKIKELVDSGEFEIAFTLFPIAFSEIRKTADHNEILPPKSTYIEPKFRSGLMIYEL